MKLKFFLFCSALFVLLGCGQSMQDSQTIALANIDKEAAVIGVSVSNTNENAEFASAFQGYAKQYPETKFIISDAQDNQQVQMNGIDDMISSGTKALIINLVDTTQAAAVIQKAKAANLPVIFFNRSPNPEVLRSYDKAYFIDGDPVQAGVLQGLDVLSKWKVNPQWDKNKDGKIQFAMLTGAKDNPSTKARTKWSVSTIQSYPELATPVQQIFLDSGVSNTNVANLLVSRWLELPESDEIEVILSNDDSMAVGALMALKSRNLSLPVFGIDATLQGLGLVKSGDLAGTVYNNVHEQALTSIRVAKNLIGQRQPMVGMDYRIEYQTILVPYQLVTEQMLAQAKPISLTQVTQNTNKGSGTPLTMAVVGKIGGIPWFNAMEQGVLQQAKELGVDAFMVNPKDTNPQSQIKIIEDLIARNVSVIGVVPNDAPALETVFKKAREKGITVITHESPKSVNIDTNFEMISTQSFGNSYGSLVEKTTGCKGKYAVYVGDLTTPAHNQWADATIDYLKKACPNMTQAGARLGVAESAIESEKATAKLIHEYPDLTAVMSFGSQGPIGAAQAAKSNNMAGKLVIVGLFSATQGKELVHEGVITGGYIWSPLDAGKVFVQLGKMIRNGDNVNNQDFIPILGEVKHDGKIIYANTPLSLDKSMVDALSQMGL
ncbi:substrate-binding domain-containing protein [Paralysiella testudinis]|uniref:D-galactose/methyl-galactoside binding periplasmic protein MglB n=1 Tax=Paralysiella testudinis TaxID=2809020 RepID=A0A892ZKW9_9NEIS|nr:substrate-binding domain-containing protein [Paralysiella testudinis]QRQ83100.1 substrate-binding domain-containing protein [Paralysiella testudinis]